MGVASCISALLYNYVVLFVYRKSLEDFIASEAQELKLPKCNAFLRRLIYQTNTEKFWDKIELETRNVDKDRILIASRLKTPQERRDTEEKKYANLIAQMEDYIGFSKVIRMIVDSVSFA